MCKRCEIFYKDLKPSWSRIDVGLETRESLDRQELLYYNVGKFFNEDILNNALAVEGTNVFTSWLSRNVFSNI